MSAVLYIGLAVASLATGGLIVLYFPGMSGVDTQVAIGPPLIGVGLAGLILVALILVLADEGGI